MDTPSDAAEGKAWPDGGFPLKGGTPADTALGHPLAGRGDKARGDRARQRDTRKRRYRDRLSAIKLARGCADCGYREHAVALDFDHVDGKRGAISRAAKERGWSWIAAEIARCEVVCANCHRVRTFRRKQHGQQRQRPADVTAPLPLFEGIA